MAPQKTDFPTLDPEINAMLQRLQLDLQSLLGAQFSGLYLHGSLAAGDFDPGSSDIDFVVATESELREQVLGGLADLHARLAQESHWGAELEGSYIPRAALRRYDPAAAVHPHIERFGRLSVEHHDVDWVIQRHVLREHGLVLYGPPAGELIDPIPAQALCQATAALLHGWWAQQLDDPWRLRERHYQIYAVLTMCRARYTFAHGTVVSKPAAARWALEHVREHWKSLIRGAQMRALVESTQPETLAFIRATLAASPPPA